MKQFRVFDFGLWIERGENKPLSRFRSESSFCNRKSKIKNLKRVGLVTLLVTFALCGAGAQAQAKIPRVGILFVGGRDQPHLAELKQGLREQGYNEGRNILLEYRYAEGDYNRLPGLAQELVREGVDIIITTSTYSAIAARNATATIPIVITSGNPVQPGLAESFAKPGGNVTGFSVLLSDLSGKGNSEQVGRGVVDGEEKAR